MSAIRERELVDALRAFLACGPDYGGQFSDDFGAYMEKFDIALDRVTEAMKAYGDLELVTHNAPMGQESRAPMSVQQQHYQAGMLPVTSKFAQLSPDEFRTSLSETWQASKAILDMVADQVEGQLITPVQGAQVTAAITDAFFGVREFNREVTPADLALLNWQRPGNGS